MDTTSAQDWNYPSVLEVIATVQPDEPALVHGDVVRTWAELRDRSSRLAGALRAAGVGPGDVVALYMTNRAEYLEALFGILAAGAVPANTNYRYVQDELEYLWRDAAAAAVIFEAAFADRARAVRAALPEIGAWIEVGGDGSDDAVADYEDLIADADPTSETPTELPVLLVYTGGTTGMPKGVMWRQGDLLSLFNTDGRRGYPNEASGAEIAAKLQEVGPGHRQLVACPLMHGTGLFHALGTLASGGCVVTLDAPKFDAELLLDVAEARRIQSMVIVGDPFARPMAEALDAHPDRWDLSALRLVFSSGAMWSKEIKARLIEHAPPVRLVDGLGSSEATAIGSSVSGAGAVDDTAAFMPGENTAVILEDGTFAQPGDGRTGLLALAGYLPVGYHNDPVKTAETFRTVGGRRWAVPGDFAQLEADGRIRLLGRGSGCINTAGEKVFPEEVEEALKLHDQVVDAAVVGVDEPRYGQAVVALVEAMPEVDVDSVTSHVRERLAGYKVPKLVHVVPSVGRAANGKLDRKTLQAIAQDAWAAVTPS